MRNAFMSLNLLKSRIDSDLRSVENEGYQKEVYKKLEDFILSGCYTNYSKKNILFNNIGLINYDLAKLLNVSEECVRKLKSSLTADIVKILGADIFDLIQKGDVDSLDTAKRRIDACNFSCMATTLFSYDIIGKIKEASLGLGESSYEMSDCMPELNLMRWLSSKRIIELISCVDVDRLNYIINVLDGREGGVDKKLEIMEFMSMPDKEALEKYGARAVCFPPRREDVINPTTVNAEVQNSQTDNKDSSDDLSIPAVETVAVEDLGFVSDYDETGEE